MNAIYLNKLISKNHAIQFLANAAYSASTVKLSLLAMAALLVSACSSNSPSSGLIEEQSDTLTIFTSDEASKMKTLIPTPNGTEYYPIAEFESSSVSLAQSSDSFIVKDNVLYASDRALIGDGKAIFTSMNDLNFKINGNSFVPEQIVSTINVSVKEVEGSESPGLKISPVGNLEVNLPKNTITNNWTDLGDDDIRKIKDFLTDKLKETDLNESISTLLIEAIISHLQSENPETASGGQETYNLTLSVASDILIPYTHISMIAMDLISIKDSLTVDCKADTLTISDGSHQLVNYNYKEETLELDLQSMISDNLNETVNIKGTVIDSMLFEGDCENCALVDIDDKCDPSSIWIHAKQDDIEFIMRMFDASKVVKIITDVARDTHGDAVASEVSESFNDYFTNGKYPIYSYSITNDFDSGSNNSRFTVKKESFEYPLLTQLENKPGYEEYGWENNKEHELSEAGFSMNDELQFSSIEVDPDLLDIQWSEFLGFTIPKLTVLKQGEDTEDSSYTYGVSQAWSQENLLQLNPIFDTADYSLKLDDFSITTSNSADVIKNYDVSVHESILNKDGLHLQSYSYESQPDSTAENSFEELYANALSLPYMFFE